MAIALWNDQFIVKEPYVYEELIARMELLSRTEFVELFKKAGYRGEANKFMAHKKR